MTTSLAEMTISPDDMTISRAEMTWYGGQSWYPQVAWPRAPLSDSKSPIEARGHHARPHQASQGKRRSTDRRSQDRPSCCPSPSLPSRRRTSRCSLSNRRRVRCWRKGLMPPSSQPPPMPPPMPLPLPLPMPLPLPLPMARLANTIVWLVVQPRRVRPPRAVREPHQRNPGQRAMRPQRVW